MVQWLGLGPRTARSGVPSLLGEVRSLKLCGTGQKKREKPEGNLGCSGLASRNESLEGDRS